jgi:hypothetical protein
MINTISVKQRCASFDSVDLVILRQKQLGKVSTVLSRDAGYQCALGHKAILPFRGPDFSGTIV